MPPAVVTRMACEGAIREKSTRLETCDRRSVDGAGHRQLTDSISEVSPQVEVSFRVWRVSLIEESPKLGREMIMPTVDEK